MRFPNCTNRALLPNAQPNVETPPWEKDVSQRALLAMMGYSLECHPSLEEVAEDYYQSRAIAKSAWWRWRFAGLVLLVFRILVFSLVTIFLVDFGWVLPGDLFHALGLTNEVAGLSEGAALMALLWLCLLIAFIFTTENKFLKRFYRY
jgi:hypothetical protein